MKEMPYIAINTFLSRLERFGVTMIVAILLALLMPFATMARNAETSELDADQFSLGMVGFVGRISGAEQEMVKILERPDADEFFLSIINNEETGGIAKLYALCGLKKNKSAAFGYAFEKVKVMNKSVSVMYGDVMKMETVSALAIQIKDGRC